MTQTMTLRYAHHMLCCHLKIPGRKQLKKQIMVNTVYIFYLEEIFLLAINILYKEIEQ